MMNILPNEFNDLNIHQVAILLRELGVDVTPDNLVVTENPILNTMSFESRWDDDSKVWVFSRPMVAALAERIKEVTKNERWK